MINTLSVVYEIILLCGAAAGLFIVIDNWRKVFLYIIKKKSPGSFVPVIGGLFVFLPVYFWPGHKQLWLYILPFIIDYGCIPIMVHTLIYCLIHKKKTNK